MKIAILISFFSDLGCTYLEVIAPKLNILIFNFWHHIQQNVRLSNDWACSLEYELQFATDQLVAEY